MSRGFDFRAKAMEMRRDLPPAPSGIKVSRLGNCPHPSKTQVIKFRLVRPQLRLGSRSPKKK